MPYKYVVFPEAYDPLTVTVDGDRVTLKANAPVKGVVLDVEGAAAKWSDQCTSCSP
jgi:beta-mannosidase